jgi:trk system potassium uptake protein TrkA
MYVIVVGCGRHGAELALRLSQKQHTVVVLETDEKEFANLPPSFNGRQVAGEPLDRDVLHRAGIERADGLAAVTRSDSLNAALAHVARTVYHVPHVVSRNFHPRWRPVHEAFGLEVVSSTDWGVQRMEELLYHQEMHTVYSAGNGEVEIYEIMIGEQWQGHTVDELVPEGQAVAVSVTRGGRSFLPTADTCLELNDTLHVSATLEGIETLRHRLAEPPKEMK